MEFLSLIVGLVPCFYDHTSKHTVYIRDLKKNLQALSKEMVDLNNLCEDVKARVEDAEQGQMIRTKEVGGWIREVENMVKDVHEILQRGDQEIQKICLRCCPRNCWSSYKIGKAVSEKLAAVSGQIGKGHFDVVAEMLSCPLVDEQPMEETVGSELAYGRICGFLNDPQVGIMGLYGMGGVGKTTLLKKINNDFLTTSSDFDVVIWVVVSKPSNIEKIQEVIWNKLQIPRDIWEFRSSKEEKAVEILRVLKTKKFVLLLDDIWERLDLLEMGVPRPDARNKSKIVFTTRSQDVCHQMKAHKSIEVACLSSEAAWTLFQKEVGEETLSHPHILRLAKTVAEECKGLPLALITLGRALASERDPSNWDKIGDVLLFFLVSGIRVRARLCLLAYWSEFQICFVTVA
ncbi:probable disease resistance protein At1g61190 isoform X3 [Vitis riparia]|uniref:probable disease resistance protein At1g61190 isoform X3 n=1 Tax=Vitis riparia TaxID=96939 RepID=UPI00155AE4A2|nr:probable disease resistance protein At1g61190 isoform X3 [Vitis riparia]